MVDIQALPIAIAPTLWDAAPIFLSVGLALAVVARAALSRQGFHIAWSLRDVVGIEGIVYVAIFQPILLPVLGVVGVLHGALAIKKPSGAIVPPDSPGRAAYIRAAELVGAILYGSVAAAIVKIGAPSLPENLAVQALIAIAAGIVVGGRSGAAAIPAVAIAVHAGGILPASLCLGASLLRAAVPLILNRRSAPAESAT